MSKYLSCCWSKRKEGLRTSTCEDVTGEEVREKKAKEEEREGGDIVGEPSVTFSSRLPCNPRRSDRKHQRVGYKNIPFSNVSKATPRISVNHDASTHLQVCNGEVQ